MVIRQNHSKSAVSEILKSAYLAVPTTLHSTSPKYGGWESSMRCNFRKHMQIKKLTCKSRKFDNDHFDNTQMQMLTMQTNNNNIKIAAFLFVCLCCEYLQYIYLLVLWVFAMYFFVCVVSICNLFFLFYRRFVFAARWALFTTVPKSHFFPVLMLYLNFSRLSWPSLHVEMRRIAVIDCSDICINEHLNRGTFEKSGRWVYCFCNDGLCYPTNSRRGHNNLTFKSHKSLPSMKAWQRILVLIILSNNLYSTFSMQ